LQQLANLLCDTANERTFATSELAITRIIKILEYSRQHYCFC